MKHPPPEKSLKKNRATLFISTDLSVISLLLTFLQSCFKRLSPESEAKGLKTEMESTESLLANSPKNEELTDRKRVLGFGTLWTSKHLNLLKNKGSSNSIFTGRNAIREYQLLANDRSLKSVPVSNTGEAGTIYKHWRERVFDNELMTGFFDVGENPISKMSIAALEDMGYEVKYEAADPYKMPDPKTVMSKELDEQNRCAMCSPKILRTDPIVLEESAMI